jgi:hypothetical protein
MLSVRTRASDRNVLNKAKLVEPLVNCYWKNNFNIGERLYYMSVKYGSPGWKS